MLVSVVIVNWNRKDDCLKAIQSLVDQTHKDIEIIVVDNHSDDGSQQAIREKYPQVILMEMPHSKFSACKTFNLGMEAAKGDIVAIMDNDATWTKPAYLVGKQGHISMGRQIRYPEAVRKCSNNIQRAPPDGARGAKDGNVSNAIHWEPIVTSR